MVGKLLFMFLDAPIELVGEGIDRCVHILFDGVGVYRAAVQKNRGFGFVSQLFYGEDAVNVNDAVRVSDDAIQLFLHIAFEGGSDIDMMTRDVQLHDASCT